VTLHASATLSGNDPGYALASPRYDARMLFVLGRGSMWDIGVVLGRNQEVPPWMGRNLLSLRKAPSAW